MGFKIKNKQTGFTLIEVLVVMLVLVAVASVTIETSAELAFQSRFEITKDRAKKNIRAIIGRPNSLVNGQPDISGFVADMGRMPTNLRELLQRSGDCDNDDGDISNTECTSVGGTWDANAWNDNSVRTIDSATRLKYGWNGPYLSTSEAASSDGALGDGWANESADDDYGWNVVVAANVGDDFSIKSLGMDQVINADGCLNYEDDCEYKITAFEYTITPITIDIQINSDDTRVYTDLGTCDITFSTKQSCLDNAGTWTSSITVTSTPQILCMKVYYREDDGTLAEIESTYETSPVTISRDGTIQLISFEFDTAGTPVSPPNAPKIFPNGLNAIGVYEHNGTNCTTTIYPASHPINQVLFASYKTLNNLTW